MTGSTGARAQLQERTGNSVTTELLIVFCLFVALGFPGSYTKVYGERIGTLCEYGAFFLEIGLMLFTSAGRWQEIELIHLEKKYYVLYLYALFTFAESMLVTSDPARQAITCIRLIVTLLFVIWLQNRYSLGQMLEMICIAQGIFILFTLVLMLRHRSLAYETTQDFTNALCGLYETKNACATELDFGIIMTVCMIRSKMRRRAVPFWSVVLLAAQCFLLLLCQATGAIVTAVLAFFPVLFFRKLRPNLGLWYIVINILFLFSMLTLMPLFEGVIIAMGKDATLTGRIPMWRQIIEVMMGHNTLLGYGYGMFWRDSSAVYMIQSAYNLRLNPFMATLTTGAHNVVLEMWLNSGLLGIGAFFAAMLHSFRDMREMDDDVFGFCLTVTAFLTINGLTERCLGGNYDYRMLSVLLVMAIGCRYAPEQDLRIRKVKPAAEKNTGAAE